jgi:hypothetical protein
MLVFLQQVLIGDPEDGIVAELVTKLLFDLSVPFFGAIGPGSFPDTLAGLTPWVAIVA